MTHAHVLTTRLLAAIAGAGLVALGCGGSVGGDGTRTGTQTGSGGAENTPPPEELPTAQCGTQFDEVCYTRDALENMVRFGGGQIPITPTPTDAEVDAAFLPNGCLPMEKTFDGCCNPASAGPVKRGDECCYVHCTGACCGRPLVVGGAARVAAAVRRSDWSEASDVRSAPTPAAAPALRAAIARAWLEDALLEHASVASFSRFALDLLAFGAPADLVELAHRAALDEIEHARLCFALAARHGAGATGPGPLALDGAGPATSLEAAVVAAVREGCVGETVAALVAGEQLARAEDTAVRRALARIAEDEARHAELAFRFVAWALQNDASLAPAVRRVFDEELAKRTLRGPRLEGDDRAAWNAAGRLTGEELAAVEGRARTEVIAVAARALLGMTSPDQSISA